MPVSDFGRDTGNLSTGKVSRDAMVASYQKEVPTPFREAADALARRARSISNWWRRCPLEQAAHEAYTIEPGRYTEGIDLFLGTLDAECS